MIDRDIVRLYSGPQQGGDLPYFRGKQYGGNWKATLGRYAIPLMKKFGLPVAKFAGQAILRAGENVMTSNKKPIEALKEAAREILPKVKSNAKGAFREAVSIMDQGGGSRGMKRKGMNINKDAKRMKTIFS
jgi:hypothetical protein